MDITLNGEPRSLADGATVAHLIAELDLANRRTAVEVNREVVPRSTYADVTLNDGDAVEIVHAVGGG
ncbi:MAG: sulfur carrier protein ThiS [Gammaproteobacteria bacterium]|nr:sulfur carrier protein ThiS [Gammaproteobacteria bacterium]